MASSNYSVQNYTIDNIIGFIKSGTIAIPEIQRPFVWSSTQVRDFIDSLYNNYPVGYIITWQNHDVKLKDGSLASGKRILIDGQQRVTALMAAIVGRKVFNEDYQKISIKIAYNPFPEPGKPRFEVQNTAIMKDSKWIKDISELFTLDFNMFTFINEFSKASQYDPEKLSNEITVLKNIVHNQIGVIELSSDLEIEQVAEIFVRINSKGTTLNQADFVMSKISSNSDYGGDDLRKMIDHFCHLMKKPEFLSKLEENDPAFLNGKGRKVSWAAEYHDSIFVPDYNDILRTSFMYSEKKGKLADLVSLLSGRNFETKQYEEDIARRTFENLSAAVDDYVNRYTFDGFIVAIKSTGFRYERMLGSRMTLDFSYALYLILHRSDSVPRSKIPATLGDGSSCPP